MKGNFKINWPRVLVACALLITPIVCLAAPHRWICETTTSPGGSANCVSPEGNCADGMGCEWVIETSECTWCSPTVCSGPDCAGEDDPNCNKTRSVDTAWCAAFEDGDCECL